MPWHGEAAVAPAGCIAAAASVCRSDRLATRRLAPARHWRLPAVDGRLEGETGVASTDAQTGYAPVGDSQHVLRDPRPGRPTILLHGAYMTIDMIGPILPGLAESRQVIAAEQQGHGRTADVDRPLTYEQMADDTAALVRHLEHRRGRRRSATAWAAASPCSWRSATRRWCGGSWSRRPPSRSDGMHAEALEMFPSITPELFAGISDRGGISSNRAEPRRLPEAGREAEATRHDALRLVGGGHSGDRRAHADHSRGLRRRPPRARRRALPAARRRRDG